MGRGGEDLMRVLTLLQLQLGAEEDPGPPVQEAAKAGGVLQP